MFKENSTEQQRETDTIIGPSVKVEGDFVTEGNIIVEGTICGSIKTSRNLKVGSKSRIFANTTAENALIAGEIQGNVSIANKLELAPTAKIFGDIRATKIVMSEGAIINGKCMMGDKTKSLKPDFSKQKRIELRPESIKVQE